MQTRAVRRREAVVLLVAIAMTAATAARGQDANRIRRVGVLMNLTADHPDAAARTAALRDTLRAAGWFEGRNIAIEYRWGGADATLYPRYAEELVALAPDVIVAAASGRIVGALQRATDTIPIVLAGTTDPVRERFIESLPRPGGNVTGFSRIDYSFSAKWLELLKQAVPGLTRAAILHDANFNGDQQVAAIKAAAPSLQVAPTSIEFTTAGEVERAIATFAQEPNGGLVVTGGTWATVNSATIVDLAARYRLPAVYPNASHVARGGLVSYGPSVVNQYRLAAGYVDRILRGAKAADLPVQTSASYETVLNLKTARALGLALPRIVLLRADQFIE